MHQYQPRNTAVTTLKLGSAILLLILLTSCHAFFKRIFNPNCYPEMLTFSEVAYHGTYEGWLEDYPLEGQITELVLELEASYLDESSYGLTGEFILGDEDPLDVTGTVKGMCEWEHRDDGSLDTQMSPPPGEAIDMSITRAGQEVWTASWNGYVRAEQNPDELEVMLRPADDSGVFPLELSRTGSD